MFGFVNPHFSAGVMLGAAGALAAIGTSSPWRIPALLIAVLAAFAAIRVLWPQRFPARELRAIRDTYLTSDRNFTELMLLDSGIRIVERMHPPIRRALDPHPRLDVLRQPDRAARRSDRVVRGGTAEQALRPTRGDALSGCDLGPAQLTEVHLAVGIDGNDFDPRPEPLGAGAHDSASVDLRGVDGVAQQSPVQTVVVFTVEIGSEFEISGHALSSGGS